MSNKTACIVWGVLFFPGMFFWSYVFDVLFNLEITWLILPTIVIGSIYLTLTGIMTWSGFSCWMGETEQDDK